MRLATVIACVLLASTAPAYAQAYAVSAGVIAAGGGALDSSGGAYMLGGTIGEPVATPAGFGPSTATAGFWSAVLPTAAIDTVDDGSFANGTTSWLQFGVPDPGGMVSQVNGGVFEFQRLGSQAVVFQRMKTNLPSGEPVRAQFQLGNSDNVRKRVSVLVQDADFSDLHVCTFWLPASAPLATYSMRTHSTRTWSDMTIAFYAATAGGGGFYRLDDVSVEYSPADPADETNCLDPLAPGASGGVDGPNLLVNGDFSSGSTSPGWSTFGQIQSRVAGGVFEFIKLPGAPAGVVFQSTSQPMVANQVLTATFDLGNSSTVRKRVTVLVHDADFSDLSACTFWLEPGQPLSAYSMKMFTTKAWSNATFSVYPATVGAEQWIQLDNATLRRTDSATTVGTECLEPGASGNDVWSGGGRRAPTSLAVTLEAGSRATADASGGDADQDAGRNERLLHEWLPDGFREEVEDLVDGHPVWSSIVGRPGPLTLTRTEPIRVSAGETTLTFRSWLTSPTSRASVEVSFDGIEWTTLLRVEASDTWVPVEADLSPYRNTLIFVRFRAADMEDASWNLALPSPSR